MGKGQKPSWTFIFGIVIQLFFASVLVTSEVAFRKDGVDSYYASLLKECKKIKLPNGTEIQTVPKLLQTPLVTACSTWKSKYGPPLRQAVCRFPDCLSNPCQYGWCEETLQGYQCLCFPGFRGKQCAERWTLPTDGTTVSSSDSSQSATSPTSKSGFPITTVSSGNVDTNTISTSDPESPSTPTSTATDSTTVTPSDYTLESTFPVSKSGSPSTAASTPPTDAMTITPSDSTLQATSPASTSSPTTTTGSSTPTDATTITPSDSTLPVTSPTSTSGPPMTTAKVFVTDPDADAIFVSEMGDTLHFTSIPSSSDPRYIKYDPTEKHIYWSDWDDRSVYRSNLDGEDREQVTAVGSYEPWGIAIAERTRILYIGYWYAHKVTSMSIERGSPLPGTETDFVNHGIDDPRALIIDEEEGFLYISRHHGIVRALLNATNNIEEIYHNEAFTHLTGLSIDLTRHPRRIFFCDWLQERTFYKELSTSTAVELTEYTHNPYQEKLRDVKYFNNTLYWVKLSDPKGIGIMTNYDQTNRSYIVQEISQFQSPRRILITDT